MYKIYQSHQGVFYTSAKRGLGGFTLIELLVVVLIIGLLAGVALPAYRKSVDRSRWTQMLLIERAVSAAQEAYYMENNKYARDFYSLPVSFPSKDGRNFSSGDTHAVFYIERGEPYLEVYRQKKNTSYEDVFLLTFYYSSPKKVLRQCRPVISNLNPHWQDLCKYLLGAKAKVQSNGWVVLEE